MWVLRFGFQLVRHTFRDPFWCYRFPLSIAQVVEISCLLETWESPRRWGWPIRHWDLGFWPQWRIGTQRSARPVARWAENTKALWGICWSVSIRNSSNHTIYGSRLGQPYCKWFFALKSAGVSGCHSNFTHENIILWLRFWVKKKSSRTRVQFFPHIWGILAVGQNKGAFGEHQNSW